MPLLWCNVPLTAAYMWQPYCTMVGAFLWLMCALKWWAVKVYHTSEFTPSYNVYVLLCLCAHITRAAARTYLYSLWHYAMYRKDIFGVCKYLVKLLHVGRGHMLPCVQVHAHTHLDLEDHQKVMSFCLVAD